MEGLTVQNYACWLESSAMQYAKQCTFEHSKTPGVGENLYMVASSGFKKAKLASMVSSSLMKLLLIASTKICSSLI